MQTLPNGTDSARREKKYTFTIGYVLYKTYIYYGWKISGHPCKNCIKIRTA